MSSCLKLRHHANGIPIAPHGLNGTTVVGFEVINALTGCSFPVGCDTPSRNLHSRAVACGGNKIIGEPNLSERGLDGYEKRSKLILPLDGRRPLGGVADGIIRKTGQPGIHIHRARRGKIAGDEDLHRLRRHENFFMKCHGWVVVSF